MKTNNSFFNFKGLTFNKTLGLIIFTLLFLSVEFYVLSLLLKVPPIMKLVFIAFSLGIFYGYKNLFIYFKKL